MKVVYVAGPYRDKRGAHYIDQNIQKVKGLLKRILSMLANLEDAAMTTKTFENETNPHVSAKLELIIDAAEIAYRVHGLPHAEFYRQESRKVKGLLKRILSMLANLEDKASAVTDEFYKQVGIDSEWEYE